MDNWTRKRVQIVLEYTHGATINQLAKLLKCSPTKIKRNIEDFPHRRKSGSRELIYFSTGEEAVKYES